MAFLVLRVFWDFQKSISILAQRRRLILLDVVTVPDTIIFNEFVIEHYQKTSWNLTTPLLTIVRRAGLGMLIRPFDNMRMSWSNEIDREFGSINVITLLK